MSDVSEPIERKPMASKLLRGAIWIAIGALIAAALVCVIWVLIGDQDGLIGRAFLTILLLALFAGVAIAEAHLAERRPDWLALASMVSWIVVLLVGAVKIWLPHDVDERFGWTATRVFDFALVIIILQLALVHVRLFVKASRRYITVFTRVIVIVTFVMLAALAAMLVFHLTFPEQFVYPDLYWRIVIALAILAAVGTTLIPLLNALFAPRARREADPHPQQMWPTYADGRTPLPALPDGSPDINAYYTGRPSHAASPPAAFPTLTAMPHPYGQSATPPATTVPPAPPVAPRAEQRIPEAEERIGWVPEAGHDTHRTAPTAPVTPPAPPIPPAQPAPPASVHVPPFGVPDTGAQPPAPPVPPQPDAGANPPAPESPR